MARASSKIAPGMNSPPEMEPMAVAESRSKYSPRSIMKRLAHMNRPELKWIIAAMITVALLGKCFIKVIILTTKKLPA